MSPAELAAIDAYAERIAASTPDPSPATAARLRCLLNPPGIAEREALAAAVDELDELRTTPAYAAERARLAA